MHKRPIVVTEPADFERSWYPSLALHWPAPRKLVQSKWESLGKVTPGGTHEKAKERRRGRAITTRSRPRSGQRTDHLGLLSQARHCRDDLLSLATAARPRPGR